MAIKSTQASTLNDRKGSYSPINLRSFAAFPDQPTDVMYVSRSIRNLAIDVEYIYERRCADCVILSATSELAVYYAATITKIISMNGNGGQPGRCSSMQTAASRILARRISPPPHRRSEETSSPPP